MSSTTDATVQSGGDATRQMAPADPGEIPLIPDVVIDSELGRGGMGVVWRGRQTYLDRAVAVKVLRLGADREWVARFQREARILAGLAHPHIVACHHAGLTPAGEPFLVMEFIDGPTLRQWIDKHGPLEPADALRLGSQLAEALGHAHRAGIIHRDVKPENVLLARDPHAAEGARLPWLAKLVDLGLARPAQAAGDMNLTRQGVVLGTPATMAPEQFDDPEGVDFRADIYGLGCVLYHALTGHPAFHADTIQQLITRKITGEIPRLASRRAGLPGGLDDFLGRLLAKDRSRRPASWFEVARECERLAAGGGERRGRSPLPALAAAAMVLALGAGAWWLATRPAPAPLPAPVAATTPTPAPTQAPAPARPSVVDLASLAWGAPQPLFPIDLGRRLEGWKPQPGARWAASELRDDALTGVAGVIERDLGALPARFDATLVFATAAGRQTDRLQIGVRLADGSATTLAVVNLGAIFHVQVARYQAGDDQPTTALGPHVLPARAEVPVHLLVAGNALRVEVAGVGGLALELASPPQRLLLAVDASCAPGEVAALTRSAPR